MTVKDVNGADGEILARVQKRLNKAFLRIGTWRGVAAELGINHGHISKVIHGQIPVSSSVRAALGFPRVMPSERKARKARVYPLIGFGDWEKYYFKKPKIKWRLKR